MPTLAIDTATDVLSIALGDASGAIDHANLCAGRQQLEMLLPEIYELLERNNSDFTDIDGIIAGTGPGMFSSLRVSIATARGLAQALCIPVSGASSLKALAMGLLTANTSSTDAILPLIDARRGQVFTQLFQTKDGISLFSASEVECLNPDRVGDFIDDRSNRTVLGGGNGALAHRGVLKKIDALELLAESDDRNQVSAVYHLSSYVPGSKFRAEGLLQLLPVYVREPDADKTVLLRKREQWQT